MPRKLLMGDLVTRSLRRVGLDATSPFTPPEVKSLISEMYGELYSIVVNAGFRYFEANDTITADGSTSYAIPDNHDCTIGIDRIIDATGQIEQLDELMVQERDRLAGIDGDARYYAMVGQSIVLYPRPLSGTYTHIYVPQSPDISAYSDTTEVDVVTADGESFLINGVAAKMAPKTETDPNLVLSEREAARQRFAMDVGRRALINPRRRIVRPTPFEEEWFDW